MNKIKKILLMGLIILAVAGLIYVLLGAIYSVIPKYQINSVKVDEDYIVVTKLNTVTGEVIIELKNYGIEKFSIEERRNRSRLEFLKRNAVDK